MGKEIYEKYEEAKEVYNKASKILDIDVAKLCFDGNEEELNKTENTQIAILITSLAMLEVLRKNNIEADIVAGLSLGEYTALIYAGVISIEDGISLIRKRGQIMQNNIPEGNWKMAAIIGLENETVEEICMEANEIIGFCKPANYNCPGQVVVSGEEKAIETVIDMANERGAKKAILLNTSGPFHTIKLEKAKQEFQKELEKVNIGKTKIEVVRNIDGRTYGEEDDIRDILARHMLSPVRFDETIKYMLNDGVDTFIEIGPGKTLTGFIKRASKEVKTANVNDLESLEQLVSYESNG